MSLCKLRTVDGKTYIGENEEIKDTNDARMWFKGTLLYNHGIAVIGKFVVNMNNVVSVEVVEQ